MNAATAASQLRALIRNDEERLRHLDLCMESELDARTAPELMSLRASLVISISDRSEQLARVLTHLSAAPFLAEARPLVTSEAPAQPTTPS